MLSGSIERKFVECFSVDDYEVLSDTGFVDITSTNKTIPYQVYRITLSDGNSLLCADDHIIFTEHFDEIFAKDSLGKSIITQDGIRSVVEISDLGYETNMYDLSVDGNHRYYSNGILSHNTSVYTVIALHFSIYNPNKQIGILANKESTAIEILDRIKRAYEHLPFFLKCGVKEFNKKSIEFDNGSKIMASASSSDNLRGFSLNMVIIDEMAFLKNVDSFMTSVLPTISSGKTSKLLIASTPNGLNAFYEYVKGAREGTNNFMLTEAPWWVIPGRDEAWKARTLAEMNNDVDKFAQEYACEFIGSSGTLLNGTTLKRLSPAKPLTSKDGLSIYTEKAPKRVYTMNCDVSHGKGLDYSAFSVIDVTELPYKQVAAYRNNTITPKDYAEIINNIARYYNDAFVLVENNDIGSQVTYILWNEFEYGNLLSSQGAGRLGKKLVIGVGSKTDYGIRMTSSVKKLGCSILKLLVEQNQLELVDKDLIIELTRFSRKNDSYAAEDGCTDDMVMGVVNFAWMTTTECFKGISGQDVIGDTTDFDGEELMNRLLGMGVVINGVDQEQQYEKFDGDDDLWVKSDYPMIAWG